MKIKSFIGISKNAVMTQLWIALCAYLILAVTWLLRHPSRIMPVMGTNNLDRIQKLSSALEVKMSREEWFVLLEAANGVEVA